MSVKGLNEFVGRACISDSFRAGLMNGQRAELIHLPDFELDSDEVKALLAITADDFASFAAAVEQMVDQRESRSPGRGEGAFASALWPHTASTGTHWRQLH